VTVEWKLLISVLLRGPPEFLHDPYSVSE